MGEQNLPKEFWATFKYFFLSLKLMGYNILDDSKFGFNKKFWRYLLVLCSTALYFVLELMYILKTSKTKDRVAFAKIVQSINSMFVFGEHVITMTIMVLKKQQLKRIIFSIAELWPSYNEDEDKAKLKQKWLKRIYLYNKMVIVVTFFGAATYELLFFLFTIHSYFSDQETNYMFFMNLYRLEMNSLFTYTLYYAADIVIASCSHCLVQLPIMMLMSVLTFNISMLLSLIRCDLENVIKFRLENNRKSFDCDETFKAVVSAVRSHQKLLRLTKYLNDLYGLITFVPLCVMFYFTCSSLFLSILIDASYSLIFVVGVTELWSITWPGQILMDMSLSLADGAYRSLWYESDSRTRKLILIIILRSQKPAKLSALGFTDLNLKTVAAVLSSSWSYFSILKQLYLEDKRFS